MNEIRWLSRGQFWLRARHEPAFSETIPGHIEVALNIDRLNSVAGVGGATHLDCDFPGPATRWYGEAKGHLFVLDVPEGKDWGVLELANSIEAKRAVVRALSVEGALRNDVQL